MAPLVKFHNYKSPLSALRFSEFKVKVVTFNSLETFINAQKCIEFEDRDALEQVMGLPNPFDARWVKVSKFNKEVWEEKLKNVLVEGLTAKFF